MFSRKLVTASSDDYNIPSSGTVYSIAAYSSVSAGSINYHGSRSARFPIDLSNINWSAKLVFGPLVAMASVFASLLL